MKRVKSFLWRGGMIGVAAFVAYALDNLAALELPQLVTLILGLILGEVSKALNAKAAK